MKSLAILLACCLAAVALAAEQKRYDGHELLKIHPRDQKQIDYVYETSGNVEFDFWYEGKDRVDILVPPHLVTEFKYQLNARDIFFTVENADIQKDIDAELQRLAEKQPQAGRALDYDDFNTYDDIIAELDQLVARCPSTVSCETFVIGKSVENRDLKGLRIYRGTGRPAVWLDATTHAREWLSTATHLKIAKHLIDDFSDPQVSNLLDTYDWWLVPVANPDGYVYTRTERLWRKNRAVNSGSSCMGVDLNRNYNEHWRNAGTSISACSDTYGGPSAASEPETKAVQAALDARGSSLILSIHFHTYGQLWLMPWGSVNPDQSCNYATDNAELLVVANAAADAVQSTYNTSWKRGNSCATIYPASGITMDYSKAVAGVKYTFTPELRGNSFIVDKNQIQPSFVEVWNGVLAAIRTIERQEAK